MRVARTAPVPVLVMRVSFSRARRCMWTVMQTFVGLRLIRAIKPGVRAVMMPAVGAPIWDPVIPRATTAILWIMPGSRTGFFPLIQGCSAYATLDCVRLLIPVSVGTVTPSNTGRARNTALLKRTIRPLVVA